MSILEHLKDENNFVAYLDVLGFKEIVKSKGKRLDKYFEAISNALKDIGQGIIKSQLISDATILACPYSEENFIVLLEAIQNIQVRCCLENIWIRGAISTGDIYFNRDLNIVVGNGLTDAYLLESQEKFPRVIIDPRIVFKISGARLNLYRLANYVDDVKKKISTTYSRTGKRGFFSSSH